MENFLPLVNEMMAAIAAAQNGHHVTLYEKNEKLGKKVFITGKGRCNVTYEGDNEDFLNNVVNNSKFLISSINAFNNKDLLEFLKEIDVKTKLERGNRIFADILYCRKSNPSTTITTRRGSRTD